MTRAEFFACLLSLIGFRRWPRRVLGAVVPTYAYGPESGWCAYSDARWDRCPRGTRVFLDGVDVSDRCIAAVQAADPHLGWALCYDPWPLASSQILSCGGPYYVTVAGRVTLVFADTKVAMQLGLLGKPERSSYQGLDLV